MMHQLTTFGTALMLVACDSSINNSDSYASPDGKRIIAVVEELQGANDPAPWWTHVSLRKNGDELSKIPGNLLKLDGRGAVIVQWNGDREVTIFIEDMLFSQVAAPQTEKEGVQISFRRASARIATNSEQPGTGQPATRPVDEPEGGDKPQPEAEGRSR